MQPPEAGLLMLEWEEDRAVGGVATSDWVPLLSVPTPAMAAEINKHAAVQEANDAKWVGSGRAWGSPSGLLRGRRCVLCALCGWTSKFARVAGGLTRRSGD